MTTNSFYGYKKINDPTNLAVSLTTLKTHLKKFDTIEDDYLTLLIKTATTDFENYTNRTLINTIFKGFLDSFTSDPILIRKSKVQSISSINYLKDATLKAWLPTNYYFTDDNDFSRLLLTTTGAFPTDADPRLQAIEINFVAGYGDTSTSIPYDIQMALLQVIADMHYNRGDCSGDDGSSGISQSIKNTYNKYKILLNSYCIIN